jgi:hypothetical protein
LRHVQLHQYQQREHSSHLDPLNTKNNTAYDVGNPSPGLGQAHKRGGVNKYMKSQSSQFENWISNGNTGIHKPYKNMYLVNLNYAMQSYEAYRLRCWGRGGGVEIYNWFINNIV